MENHRDNAVDNVPSSGANNDVVSLSSPLSPGFADDSYFNSFPDGYRFMPTDEELILCYLKKKINNEPLRPNRIRDVEFYKFNPEELAEKYTLHREKERYFFTPRDRKYKGGRRPGRAARNGFWKATGRGKVVTSRTTGEVVGMKQMLVFYRGNAKKSTKTDWVMLEYVVASARKRDRDESDMRLDDCVLVKLYEKTKSPSTKGSSEAPKTTNSTGKRRKKNTKKESQNEVHGKLSDEDEQEGLQPSIEEEAAVNSYLNGDLLMPLYCQDYVPTGATGHSNNHYASTSFAANQPSLQANFNTFVSLNGGYNARIRLSSNTFCASANTDRFADLSSMISNGNPLDGTYSNTFVGSANTTSMSSLEQNQHQWSDSGLIYPLETYDPTHSHAHERADLLFGAETLRNSEQMQASFPSSSVRISSDVNDQNVFDEPGMGSISKYFA